MNVHKLIGLFGGKKFVAVMVTILTAVLRDHLGLNDEVIKWVIGLVSAFCVGQGVADGMTGGLTSSQPGTPTWTPGSEPPK